MAGSVISLSTRRLPAHRGQARTSTSNDWRSKVAQSTRGDKARSVPPSRRLQCLTLSTFGVTSTTSLRGGPGGAGLQGGSAGDGDPGSSRGARVGSRAVPAAVLEKAWREPERGVGVGRKSVLVSRASFGASWAFCRRGPHDARPIWPAFQ